MNPVTVESMAKALQGEIQLRHTHVKAGPRHPSIEDTHGLDTSPVCCTVTTNQGSESIGILTLTQCMNPVTVESMAKALQGEIQLRHTHVKKASTDDTSTQSTDSLDTSDSSKSPRSQLLIFPTSIEF